MKNKNWKGNIYRSTCCDSLLQSMYSGQFVGCTCGKVAIDETPNYTRFIGDKSLLEIKLDKIQDVMIYSDMENSDAI